MASIAFAVLGLLIGLSWRGAGGIDPVLASAASGILAYRLLLNLGGGAALAGHAFASLLGGAALFHLTAGLEASWMALVASSLGALVLGVVLDAMVLGHWYLVQHGLSFEPLKRMSLAVLAVVAARMALGLAWAFGMGGWAALAGQGLAMDDLLFLMLRVLLGYVGPLALGWMVWACVKLKSNTSATGILYVITVFVLVGEFAAAHFAVEAGAFP